MCAPYLELFDWTQLFLWLQTNNQVGKSQMLSDLLLRI